MKTDPFPPLAKPGAPFMRIRTGAFPRVPPKTHPLCHHLNCCASLDSYLAADTVRLEKAVTVAPHPQMVPPEWQSNGEALQVVVTKPQIESPRSQASIPSQIDSPSRQNLWDNDPGPEDSFSNRSFARRQDRLLDQLHSLKATGSGDLGNGRASDSHTSIPLSSAVGFSSSSVGSRSGSPDSHRSTSPMITQKASVRTRMEHDPMSPPPDDVRARAIRRFAPLPPGPSSAIERARYANSQSRP